MCIVADLLCKTRAVTENATARVGIVIFWLFQLLFGIIDLFDFLV